MRIQPKYWADCQSYYFHIIFHLVSEDDSIQVECGGKKLRRKTFVQTTPLLPTDNQINIPPFPNQVSFAEMLCSSISFIQKRQGGKGHLAVYCTSLQSFIIMFSYSLAYKLWGLLLNFDWLVH